ncbi:hypothetical protein [Pontibacter mangrovi]|uniref:Lipoprotein n=1 Tax=Pontibacter mangrovi TaxID=2589816 RepID=A0A501W4K5_9BACT|nr:hypothetical protein [Pontibacter mangrovi]TPE43585.1 hypothetical protein FJM65_12580 [Pontibacter mangrovi]
MKKVFTLLIMPFLLFLFGCKQEGEGLEEECENFQFLNVIYPGEKVSVSFNSKKIFESTYNGKGGLGLHRLCVDYTDTFKVSLRVVKGDRTVIDTSMIGYSKDGKYLLRLPMGDPKPEIANVVFADTTGELYGEIPKDSLLRKAFLEPTWLLTD